MRKFLLASLLIHAVFLLSLGWVRLRDVSLPAENPIAVTLIPPSAVGIPMPLPRDKPEEEERVKPVPDAINRILPPTPAIAKPQEPLSEEVEEPKEGIGGGTDGPAQEAAGPEGEPESVPEVIAGEPSGEPSEPATDSDAQAPGVEGMVSAPPGPAVSGEPARGREEKAGGKPGIGFRGDLALYDPGIVHRYGEKKPREKPPAITFDTAEFRRLAYTRRLRERIESVWRYPASAIREGITGELRIRFTILADGSLGEVSIVQTSGHPDLDAAALRALKDAAPFLPLPEAWGESEFSIDGRFIYTMYGYRLR